MLNDNCNAALSQIEAAEDINQKDASGRTFLHVAAYTNCKEVVAYLVQEGADLDVLDEKGNTPLHHASYRCNDKVVDYLIDAGASETIANQNGKTYWDLHCKWNNPANSH